MMAAANNIFVYLGGDQRVPYGVTHAVIDPSVKTVLMNAFVGRHRLVSVIFHDGVEIIEAGAFRSCISLSGIKLLGVREIRVGAFRNCRVLSNVEFGDRLETIGCGAFDSCPLRSIKSLSVRTVQFEAFRSCRQLTDAEFGIDLEIIGCHSFRDCPNLQRIAIPLKDGLFPYDRRQTWYNQFESCDNLTTVDTVGAEGIHSTISSLLMESWRNEMNEEFERINRELPDTHSWEKTKTIRLWIRSVIQKMDHYKAEHKRLLKKGMTLLELAVWKTKLDEKEDHSIEEGRAKKAKIDTTSARNEQRIMSGADIVIRNVVPFLQLDE